MKYRLLFPFVGLVLLFSACSNVPQASSSSSSISEPKPLPTWAQPYFFTALPFPLESVLKDPPSEGSPEDLADRKALYEIQQTRKTPECEAAGRQAIPTMEATFGAKENQDRGLPDFSKMKKKKREALTTFYKHVQRDMFFIVETAKLKYAKKRPFLRFPDIRPCIKQEPTFTYPSGHATHGIAGAEILSLLFPKNASALKKAGVQAGAYRVLGGVHHPSDIEAGMILGKKIAEVLEADPKFKAELKATKKLLK